MNKQARIFVAGHNGLVGSSILRQLLAQGYSNVIHRTRQQLDLIDQQSVKQFLQQEKPDYVIIAAAKVGGIHANNSLPAEFIYQNLMIECNVIHQSYIGGIEKLLCLGSSCIYPKFTEQPMNESALLTGVLEPTNEPYAIAKIAGIKLCESYNRQYGVDYRSMMPTNLYGMNDNFDLQTSHVIPALLRKFHAAKINNSTTVEVWGTGSAKREFLYVDDLADACLFVMNLPSNVYQQQTKPMLSHLNVGTGVEVSIKELATIIHEVVGFQGQISWNTDYPDGAPRKLLDVSKLADLGWRASTSLSQGLTQTYQWFVDNELIVGG